MKRSELKAIRQIAFHRSIGSMAGKMIFVLTIVGVAKIMKVFKNAEQPQTYNIESVEEEETHE